MDEDYHAPCDQPSKSFVVPGCNSPPSDSPDMVSPESVQIVLDEPELPQTTTSPPPLGIVHLMLWVACWAVYLATLRSLNWNDLSAVDVVARVLLGLVQSLAWLILSVFIVRRLRGVEWAIEPGEWLGAALGVHGILTLLALPFSSATNDQAAAVYALTSCLLVVPLFSCQSLSWKLVIGVVVVLYAISSIVFLTAVDLPLTILLRAAPFVILVTISIVAIFDRRTPRNWLHWVGLMAWAFQAAFELWVNLLIGGWI